MSEYTTKTEESRWDQVNLLTPVLSTRASVWLGGDPPDPLTRRAVDPGGSVSQSRDPDAHPIRWAGVHREQTQTMAERASGGAVLYRARVSWENGYVESFNSKMRERFFSGELFYTPKEEQIMTERWRTHNNTVRPPSSLGGQPPAPETVQLAS